MSLKRGKNSVVSQKSGRTTASMDYKLFAINFYGNPLKPIREELSIKINEGLRRNIFVIDMEEEIRNYQAVGNQSMADDLKRGSKSKTDFSGKSGLLAVALNAIEKRKKQYAEQTAIMEKEKSFNLVDYWTKLPPVPKDVQKTKEVKDIVKPTDKKEVTTAVKSTGKVPVNLLEELGEEEYEYCPDDGPEIETFCLETVVAEHNQVGNPVPIMNRRYIEDYPLPEILYFVIIGEFNRDFYVDLLNANQPVQAVINFVPEESTYDHLLVRKDNLKFIKETLEQIHGYICFFREPYETKPTGFFTTHLPVISPCLAKKLADVIYSELSWYLYDIQILLRQYYQYYVHEFHETDVSLPAHVDLLVLLEKARVLEVCGHYFTVPPLALGSDIATVALYLDKLLTSVAPPAILMNSEEIEHLRDYTSDPHNKETTRKSKIIMDKYIDGFESVTEMRRYERLCVDGCNKMFISLIESMRKLNFPSIFRICLEYSLLRKAHVNIKTINCLRYTPFDENMEVITLPTCVKFHSTEGSVVQRLNQLLEEFDEYEILETVPKHRLYVFRRTYNEIFNYEKQMILPTRLCFRDFTIYQLDEFYRVLITPETKRQLKTRGGRGDFEKRLSLLNTIDPDLFVRPNSLKSTYFGEGTDIRGFGDCAIPASELEGGHEHDLQSAKKTDVSSDDGYVGLPLCHPMLFGYNLDDIRQKICTKESKYYFEEGHIKLTEEHWNFNLMNRYMGMQINGTTIYFASQRNNLNAMSKTLRIITDHDVNIRIRNLEEECAKILVTYPNGLTIYYYDTYTEQKWQREDAKNDELKRIFTPYGAVIIFYNEGQKIVVMRANGEIYHLIQFDKIEEECEGVSEDCCCQQTSLDRLAAGAMKATKRFSVSSISIGEDISTSFLESVYDELRDIIAFELNFIQGLAKIYQLGWIRLKVITSIGRVFIVPNKGLISEKLPYEIIEWNDYYCNECLTMRGDGTRLVWNEDCFRCYYSDGTAFETKTVDCLVDIFGLETDTNISQSSSHMNTQYMDGEEQEMVKKESSKKPKVRAVFFLDEGEVAPEIEEQEDARYVQVLISEFLEMHELYATVYFAFCGCFNNCSQPFMEVRGADLIRFNIEFNYEFNDSLSEFMGEEEEYPQFKPEQPCKRITTLTIWIGYCLYFSITEVDFEICTMLSESSELDSKNCLNSMCMKFQFKNSVDSLFYDLTCRICDFKKSTTKTKLLYFLEKQPYLCATQGYEFMDNLPLLSDHTLRCSNTTIEFKPIKSVNNQFRTTDIHTCDLSKFPRFHDEDSAKNTVPPKEKFPYVLETNIYLKIPQDLCDSKRIELFMQPIDQIYFKKMRTFMNEALIFHLRPELHLELSRYISFVSWQIRFQKHLRRLAIEDTRKGFYHAMLRYKEYPRYFEFYFNYEGRVSEIDIFEYMLYKCDNEAPRKQMDVNLFSKKCPCPHYIESLKPPVKKSCLSRKYVPKC